jgi:predicted metalloprotease with PDZ domain
MWLDVDTIIREQTHGAKSIDDYTKVLASGVTAPKVVTYKREDLEGYLNQVVPYDWHGFFQKYVYSIAPEPPTDEIARAGYKLVYNDTPNKFNAGRAAAFHILYSWYDVGVQLGPKGGINDVRADSPAWSAGLAPGMSVVAVNGRAFDPDLWTAAITAAKGSSEPIHLLVKEGGWYQTIDLPYHDGLKYPHLERLPGTTDMLTQITQPRATKIPKTSEK